MSTPWNNYLRKKKNFHFAQNNQRDFVFHLASFFSISMSKLIFYFFAIICFINLIYLVSGVPERKKLNDEKDSLMSHTESMTEDDEQNEDDDENDDESTIHDDLMDITEAMYISNKSNNVRAMSMNTNSFILIGFLLPVISKCIF